MDSVTLRNGVKMPLLGFGVLRMKDPAACIRCVREAYEESCRRLQTDYIDLYLIHQPYSDYYGAWRTMERLYREGRVRAVGVSNFSPERLTDLCLNSRIPPMVNQVELHPFYHQDGACGSWRSWECSPRPGRLCARG